MYDKEKVKKFKENTLDDYNKNLIVEDITKISLAKETDSTFIQIGIRPILDDDIFIDPSFHESLPGAGRIVAIGERDFLIKSILDNKDIERVKFNEDIKEFPKHVFEFDQAVILLSTRFYVEVFSKLMSRINYGEKHPKLDYRYEIISVPEKVLGNKIIIISKDAIFWKKKFFDNREKLDIKILPAKLLGKVDITIRSLNKIMHIDTDRIKILEVEELKEKLLKNENKNNN